MQTKASLKILVSPLDWGIGHATRCIPIVQAFLDQEAEVILMGSEKVLERLSANFPELEKIRTNDAEVVYSSWLPAYFSIAIKLPSININERNSYAQLQSLIKNRQIDIIISDNRYYFRSDEVFSIILSHQLKPKVPFLTRLIEKLLAKRLEKFDEIWIPDSPENAGLSGELSHSKYNIEKQRRIGILSRFNEPISELGKKEANVLIASGPEPQLSILINEFVRIYSGTVIPLTILCPFHINKEIINSINISFVSNPSDEDFLFALKNSSLIIMRSGYSSVMDLMRLGKRALLIPTPGQTEQEYIGDYLQKFGFSSMSQNQIKKVTSPEGLLKPKVENNVQLVEEPALIQKEIGRLIQKFNRGE
jgi:predicted glycosyltransferase